MNFSKMSLNDILKHFKSKGIFEVSLSSAVNTSILKERIETLCNNEKLDLTKYPDLYDSQSENHWLYSYFRQQIIYNEIGCEYVNKDGRFIKRFENTYKKIRGIKLSPTAKTLIGEIVREIANKVTYRIDFVNRINWNDGEYGKDDSCWWGCYPESRRIFIDGGGWAIRFYNKDDEGIGRVWCFPFEDSRTFVLFNAYLNYNGGPLDQFARMLVNLCGGLKYKRVGLINLNEGNDYPYINDHIGYAVSFTGEFKGEYNMDIGKRKSKYFCSCCGEDLNEDEVYTQDYDNYCENCYDSFYANCAWCDSTWLKDDLTYVSSERNGYCEDCLSNHFSICETCGEYYNDQNIKFDKESGNSYCELCYDTLLEERKEIHEAVQDAVKEYLDPEFKVGDYVIFNPELEDNKYAITNKDMIVGKITLLLQNLHSEEDCDDICIQVLEHNDSSYNNSTYFPVKSKYFVKIPL